MNLNDYIYSSVPGEVNKDFSNESKNKLRNLFIQSQESWLSSADLQKKCEFKTNVALRQAITELIETEFMTIVSGVKGYKYTYNTEDIDKYISSLESRIKGIEKRIRGLKKGK